jgi:hypothetical protein
VFDPTLICVLAGQGKATHLLMKAIVRWPHRPRQIAALGWLTLRLRPMSLSHLLITAAVRAARGDADRTPG